ncbi:hypothetical protein L1F28_29295 [Arthrospira platensis NCB002]|uniref:hypothetical protein n=2 Tax=Oscillatoriophycideae TaxID=1301283 RepID=UPI0001D0EEAE|nr:hypothetical protein [Arthrospira platensis NCB002]BAI91043.1 hypothetical protein NIES39_H01180 [Arthrospira platensis NIES-39]
MSCFVQIFANIPDNPNFEEVNRKHQSLPKPYISRVSRCLSLLSPESLSQYPPPSHCANYGWRVTSLGNYGHNWSGLITLIKCKAYHKTRNLSIAQIKKCLNVVEKGKRGDQQLRGGQLMFLMRSLQIGNGI